MCPHFIYRASVTNLRQTAVLLSKFYLKNAASYPSLISNKMGAQRKEGRRKVGRRPLRASSFSFPWSLALHARAQSLALRAHQSQKNAKRLRRKRWKMNVSRVLSLVLLQNEGFILPRVISTKTKYRKSNNGIYLIQQRDNYALFNNPKGPCQKFFTPKNPTENF